MRYAPDVSKDAYYMACEPGTQSEVAIPLEVDGEVIGVFTASHHALDAFPAEQLRLLQALCSHIAVAIHNARRFQQERLEKERMNREVEEARLIQEALLPKTPPSIPGSSIAGLPSPAGVGGRDWCHFISIDHGLSGAVLADAAAQRRA